METFGSYLTTLRKSRRVTLRELAQQIELSASYLTDIEKGRRDSLLLDKLLDISKYLKLTQEEQDKLMNLAGNQRNDIAPDLPEYIAGKDYINAALRMAKDLDAGEEEWLDFIDRLSKISK